MIKFQNFMARIAVKDLYLKAINEKLFIACKHESNH